MLRGTHPSGKRIKERKLRALCRQVFRTLHLSIPADLDAQVVSVSPDADPARLIVILAPTYPDVELGTIAQRLARLGPSLRCDVANAIHRKRAPELVFRLSRGDPAGAPPREERF